MLPESLYATTIGFVDMVWSPECQRCSGGVVDKADLCELPNQANCQGCNQANRIDSLDSRSHQSLLYVTARSILLPRNRPGMSRLFQGMHEPIRLSRLHVSDLHRFWLFVVCGGKYSPALAKGKYPVHCPFSGTHCSIVVERDATARRMHRCNAAST
jgi:hypothetical protein